MLEASVDLNVDISTDDIMQAHRKRLEDAGKVGFAFSQEVVPVDRGTLKQSGFGPEFRGDDLIIGYQARQAAPMEFGTEPGHTPPIQPLVEWAQRIGKDPGFGAYVATQVIPEKGVQAQPYLRPAGERMTQWLNNHGLDL